MKKISFSDFRFLFRILAVWFILVALFLNIGTGEFSKPDEQTKEKNVLYSVTDASGTTLKFYSKPQNIISLGQGSDEILFSLVSPARIAALTYLADDPGISAIAGKASAVKGRVQTNNIEGILSFNPDLVIMPDWGGVELAGQLRDAGVNVYIYKTPVTISEIEKSILEIAAAVGENERGKELAAEMEKRLANVADKVKAIPADKRRRVVVLSFMGPFGAEGSTFDDICRYANVENCIAELKIPQNALYSKEILPQLNPDLLVLPSWDYGVQKENPEAFKNEVMNDPAYQTVDAIKNRQVFHITEKDMYSISQNVVFAVEELARTAYPELFND